MWVSNKKYFAQQTVFYQRCIPESYAIEVKLMFISELKPL